MKKIIVNIIIIILFMASLGIGIFFLNEYIIGSEKIAELFSPIYDEEDDVITLQKHKLSESGEGVQNPLSEIQSSTDKIDVDNTDKFYYSQLDDNAKIIYDKLSENKENMKSGNYTIDFGKTFNDLLNGENGQEKMNIYYQSSLDAYLLDNPDVFYLDVTKIYLLMNSRTLGRKTTYTVTIGGQNGESYYAEGFNSREDIEQAIANTKAVKDEILSYATKDSNYDKLKVVHDLLVGNLSYDQTVSKNNIRNIYGALCEREVVCEGYAKAYKYIIDDLGIENIIVVGYGTNSEGRSEEHAWNYVKLDGNWYAVDVTWDDPIIQGGGRLTESTKHRYFLRGSHNFNESHKATGQTSQGGIIFTYPELNLADYK